MPAPDRDAHHLGHLRGIGVGGDVQNAVESVFTVWLRESVLGVAENEGIVSRLTGVIRGLVGGVVGRTVRPFHGPALLPVGQIVGGVAVQKGGIAELDAPGCIGGMLPGDLPGEGVDDDGHGVVYQGLVCTVLAVPVFIRQVFRAPDPEGDVATSWAGCGKGPLGTLVAEEWKTNVGGPVTAVAPQNGAVGGIQGSQSLVGEEHWACRAGGYLQQPRDLLLPSGCDADAGGPRGQATRGRGRSDLGDWIREHMNQ